MLKLPSTLCCVTPTIPVIYIFLLLVNCFALGVFNIKRHWWGKLWDVWESDKYSDKKKMTENKWYKETVHHNVGEGNMRKWLQENRKFGDDIRQHDCKVASRLLPCHWVRCLNTEAAPCTTSLTTIHSSRQDISPLSWSRNVCETGPVSDHHQDINWHKQIKLEVIHFFKILVYASHFHILSMIMLDVMFVSSDL